MAASLADQFEKPVHRGNTPWKNMMETSCQTGCLLPSKAKSRQYFLLIIKEIQKKVRYTVTIRRRHEGLAMQCMSKSMGNKRRAEVAKVRSTSTRYIAAIVPNHQGRGLFDYPADGIGLSLSYLRSNAACAFRTDSPKPVKCRGEHFS